MKRLKRNHRILQLLKTSNKKLRGSVLKTCNDDAIKAIVEIIINTLNGNNKISKHVLTRLKKHKSILRTLACSRKSLKAKRKILIQKGGFLPVLIGTVLSGIIGKLISSFQTKNE